MRRPPAALYAPTAVARRRAATAGFLPMTKQLGSDLCMKMRRCTEFRVAFHHVMHEPYNVAAPQVDGYHWLSAARGGSVNNDFWLAYSTAKT